MTVAPLEATPDRTLQMAEQLVSSPRGPRRPFSWTMLAAYVLLSLGTVVMVVPFIWMVLTSLKPATELLQFAFLPKEPTLINYQKVLTTSSFPRAVFQ